MSRIAAPLSLLCCLALAGVATDAVAQQSRSQQDARAQQQQARGQQSGSLSESVRRIERSTGGQVLSAEQVQFDGRNVSRIKVMDDRGRVRIYTDDPGRRPERRSGSRRDDD